ncbi:hypothetical protein G6M84_06985 [Agrobacterium tumefaciens]|uniref:hypothetical protein n=1 Tax=Agrobacterium tumefaciens TaxID=358 RepID=UPI0015740AB2|nr:hypothetical protein [Agrobacterium tumefaciens]NTB96256.1 hypothetical protein [Agrobacterium tumefaciens]NTC46781.1 hypothetical protein [Agrobacterium tumefaciens]
MLRKNFIHGFAAADWESAKAEAKEVMISRARVRGMIPYSELADKINSIRLGAHDQRFFHFLGEISQEEDAAGRGMLTVLVVHRSGDMQPGPGFYELAKLLGRDTTDLLRCWIDELHRVHAVWEK